MQYRKVENCDQLLEGDPRLIQAQLIKAKNIQLFVLPNYAECTKETDSYLQFRERQGERPLKEDAPLIREEFDVNDPIHANRPRGLCLQSFRMMVRHAGYRSGVIESGQFQKVKVQCEGQ